MELIHEMEESFKRLQRPVIRAVMATILGEIPVFFHSKQEVKDYVEGAFRSCSDMDEKMTCFELLRSIMNMEAVGSRKIGNEL
jgi:hypothetical protein